jgi:4-carboxymuconolactone decarboxylase
MSSSVRALPLRIRLLTLIAALYTLKLRAGAFELIQKTEQSQLIPRSFFSELFIHLSLFLGFPAMLDGLERLHMLRAGGRTRESSASRPSALRARGIGTLRRVYGDQASKLLDHLDDLEPGLGKRISEDAYGTVMARSGLNLAERELVNVVVLFIEGYHRQLYSHLRGAMRVGVSPGMLKDVLRLAAKTARKDVRRAISTVEDIVRLRPVRSL